MQEICQCGTQILTVIIAVLIARSKEKKNMMFWMEVSNIAAMLMFIAFGEWETLAVNILVNIRCLTIYFKDKLKHEKLIFNIILLLHIPILIWCLYDMSNGKSWTVLLPLISCIISTFSYWYLTPDGIKIIGILVGIFWIIYYLKIGAYIQVALNIWSSGVSLFYVLKYNLDKIRTTIKNKGKTEKKS